MPSCSAPMATKTTRTAALYRDRSAGAPAPYILCMEPAACDDEQLFLAESRRTLACSPSLAWALLADSNRWDRVVGCNPTTYTYDLMREGDPRSRARVGHTQQFGKELQWTEAGEWVEARFMWGERRYLRGGVRRAGFRFTFDALADGTVVAAEAYVA